MKIWREGWRVIEEGRERREAEKMRERNEKKMKMKKED